MLLPEGKIILIRLPPDSLTNTTFAVSTAMPYGEENPAFVPTPSTTVLRALFPASVVVAARHTESYKSRN